MELLINCYYYKGLIRTCAKVYTLAHNLRKRYIHGVLQDISRRSRGY